MFVDFGLQGLDNTLSNNIFSFVVCWIHFNAFCHAAMTSLIYCKTHNPLYVLIMSRTRFRVNPHSIVAWMSRNSLLEAGAKFWNLSDCNWTRTHNHLVHKRTLNHLAKLAKWLSCVVSTYLYGAIDCMFLSCHVRVSEWIHTL